MAKSALLQNQWLEWRWSFANLLMWVGKKAAGKRINFGLGKRILCSAFFEVASFLAMTRCGNLFFFGGGEKRERKSSFAVFGFAAGGADCNF